MNVAWTPPPSHPVLDIADASNFAHGHPHQVYDWLRRESPVHYQPSVDGRPAHWLLTRHADVQAVSRNNTSFTSTFGQRILEKDGLVALPANVRQAVGSSVLMRDPPIHGELRKPLAPSFLPSAMRRVEADVERFVDELVDSLAGEREIEFVSRVAAVVPIRTLCSLLGVPREDEGKVFDWTNQLVGTADPEYAPSPEASARVYAEVFDYGKYLIEKRRSQPAEDMLTLVANMTVGGLPLDKPTQDGTFVILLAAGNETTRNSLTGGILAFSQFPEERCKLAADPELVNGAVEELQRFVSPVIHMMRVATEDVEVGGQVIPKGDRVVMLYGAANRDPAVFDAPHRLDIERANAKSHLAFGVGIHHCLGAPLARLQLRILLGKLLARYPNLHAASEPAYLRSNFVAGVKRVQVALA